MSRRWLILAALVAVAVLLFVGIPSPTTVTPPPPPVAAPVAPSPLPAAIPAEEFPRPRLLARPRPGTRPAAQETEAGEMVERPPRSTRVAEALADDNADGRRGARLLALFPELTPEEQVDVASAMAADVADADYAALAARLTDPGIPELAAAILLTDLLDRPATTRLNTLLAVARQPDHPVTDDARAMLAAQLGQDHGADWELWAKKISEWLASHPE